MWFPISLLPTFYFEHILTSVEAVHSCSVKKKYRKILQTLPNLCWSPFLTSCSPRAWNCIKVDSSAQVLFSNFCEISQNSFLQNNGERLLLVVDWCSGKMYSRNR